MDFILEVCASWKRCGGLMVKTLTLNAGKLSFKSQSLHIFLAVYRWRFYCNPLN